MLLVAVGSFLASSSHSATLFVKQNATGGNNGSSWANAFTNLSAALSVATSGDEIWVAGATEQFGNATFPNPGRYQPGTSATAEASFHLKAGVKMFGGFLGTETSVFERKLEAAIVTPPQVSWLTGWGGGSSWLTQHLLRADASITEETVVDGFRIVGAGTPGAAGLDAVGGGLLNEGGSPVFRNCIFVSLQGQSGSAVYSTGGNPMFINCVFTQNTATTGAGGTFLATAGAPRLINCTVTANTAPIGGIGGVVLPADGEVVNSILWGNGGPGASVSGSGTISYSVVEGGHPGVGNLSADPLLRWQRETPRLGAGSPAIDAGNDSAVPGSVTVDFSGQPRLRAGLGSDGSFSGVPRVDLGALESGGVAFVKANAPPGGDGLTWAGAHNDLHHALTNSAARYDQEVWVAAGTYRPHTGFPADRGRSFAASVMYGGFAGTEMRRDQRDPAAHETVLSGDIGVAGNNGDNSQRIVTGGNGALIDGFTIRDGNGLDGVLGTFSGTGIAFGGNATVRNSQFINNRGVGGAAIWIGGTGIVERCVFRDNVSTLGAGALYLERPGRVESSLFEGNQSDNGGAIFAENGGELVHCTIVNNHATLNGGGVWGGALMINCILWGNSAAFGGHQIFGAGPSIVCIVQGGWPGSNLPVPSPGFADAAAGDFRLLSTSPAVDAGWATPLFAGIDAAGNARLLDGNGDGQALPDIGAYEYGVPNVITGIVIGPSRKARINFLGTTNLIYSVEASTNLVDWEVIGTATFSTSDFVYRDEAAPGIGRRYYRTRLP